MSTKRAIHGIWLIERQTGRNLISQAYSNIEIDMDLIAPFLSATHTFIDKASSETLTTIDTETHRYVWQANDYLLFVMVVSKAARLGHMRFLLEYALNEFMRNEIPKEDTVETMLKQWHGSPKTFNKFGKFVDELINQYEETDEALIAGKSMDCLEVYSHLFRAIMRVKASKAKRKKLVETLSEKIEPLIESYPFVGEIPIDEKCGVEVLSIDIYSVTYKPLREALEELLRITSAVTRQIVGEKAFREMIFEQAMPYVKRDMNRLQTYAILDDVIRYLF